MPQHCTCGAQLPEDARFCHKCGKPQREEPVVAEEAPAAAVSVAADAAAPPALPVPIGFHNGLAVRTALLSEILAFLFAIVTTRMFLTPVFGFVWLIAGGFLSVLLYGRRTGQRLTVVNGAHLGWICGIFGFVIATIFLTAMVVQLSDPHWIQEQLKVSPPQEADMARQGLDALRSPSGIFAALTMCFVLFTMLPAFGGALGAKLLHRD